MLRFLSKLFNNDSFLCLRALTNSDFSFNKTLEDINEDIEDINDILSMEDSVQIMEELEAYIIVKGHKDEFPSKIPCRLIKLSKSCLGKFIKVILDKIY